MVLEDVAIDTEIAQWVVDIASAGYIRSCRCGIVKLAAEFTHEWGPVSILEHRVIMKKLHFDSHCQFPLPIANLR